MGSDHEPSASATGPMRMLLPAILVMLGAVSYAPVLLRPLHLEHDSVCYLTQAEAASEGHGFRCAGCPPRHCSLAYPPGYPAVLALLMRSELASRPSFIALNLLALLVGLLACYACIRQAFNLDRELAAMAIGLSLLSYPILRFVNNPLSDLLFLSLASSALLAAIKLDGAAGRQRVALGVLAMLFTLAAILTRTIGVALLPAILWAATRKAPLWDRLRDRPKQFGKFTYLAAGLGIVAVGSVAVLSGGLEYISVDLVGRYGDGFLSTLFTTIRSHVWEWGQLVLNAPAWVVPESIRLLVLPLGVLFGIAVFLILWERRRAAGPIEIYLLMYFAIMIVWPYEDVRFWIPVIPLLAGLIVERASRMRSFFSRRALLLYLVVFIAAGLAGQAYNARLSLMGDRFPEAFRDDRFGPAYRKAWGISDEPAEQLIVDLLRRYEPRVRDRTDSR